MTEFFKNRVKTLHQNSHMLIHFTPKSLKVTLRKEKKIERGEQEQEDNRAVEKKRLAFLLIFMSSTLERKNVSFLQQKKYDQI